MRLCEAQVASSCNSFNNNPTSNANRHSFLLWSFCWCPAKSTYKSTSISINHPILLNFLVHFHLISSIPTPSTSRRARPWRCFPSPPAAWRSPARSPAPWRRRARRSGRGSSSRRCGTAGGGCGAWSCCSRR